MEDASEMGNAKSVVLRDIDFEGKLVVSKAGRYKCPYMCGDRRYPARKWKTEAGFRKHMAVCPRRPSALKIQRVDFELKKQEALSKVAQSPGQKIFWVSETDVKPTHVERGNRMVRVRYEAVKRFCAHEGTIESIDFDGRISFSTTTGWRGIRLQDLCESMDMAAATAARRQKDYDAYVAQAEFCR